MESEETMSTSADSVRTLHYIHTLEPSDQTVKAPHTTSISSPQHSLGYCSTSTVLVLSMPSPSSSPAIGSPNSSSDRSLSPSPSESSLPESVSSSFFFSSSGAGSPRHGGLSSLPLSGEEQEHVQEDEIRRSQRHRSGPPSLVIPSPLGLLLPSLPLPHSLRRPTTFGQTLGSLRILVLSSGSSSNLTSILLEENDDIVDVGEWEAWPGADHGDILGRVVKVSTDWKRRWAKGNIHVNSGGESESNEERLFEFEPSRNVEIVELDRCAEDVDPTDLAAQLKFITEAPFCALNDVLHPDTEPSGIVKNLLAAPNSGLWTAMVVLLDDAPTDQDIEMIRSVSTHVPLIVLPSPVSSHFKGSSRLSAFTPRTAAALRAGLFRSPERLSMLRREAVDRFLWWRAVQKWGVDDGGISREGGFGASRKLEDVHDHDDDDEDEEDASREAAAAGIWKRRPRRRAATISASKSRRTLDNPYYHPIDPLHLPSLIALSLSLFAPLKERIGSVLSSTVESLKEGKVQAALIGGFLAGVGVSLWVRPW